MKVWVGPVGQVTHGHVLDVARGPFERALRDYDSLLYVTWNPKKLKGWGCWEIRRRPEKKIAVDIVPYHGNTYVRCEYVEQDMVNHVLDCAFLNYDQLRKIRSMDMWSKFGGKGESFGAKLDAMQDAAQAREKAAAIESRRYMAKQFKSEIKDFKEMILSGTNPADIALHWDETGSKRS